MVSPRILISALRGGSGKTIVSLGLIASLRKRGVAVSPFKKGPDFIDAGWLALAAGHPCHNLDAFLIPPQEILASFRRHSRQADLSVIEGNRGLYDGMDAAGTTSTAELARLLGAPVILVVDCTKATRTVAALVLGCMAFDPEIRLAGVVLNQVAGLRHEQVLRASIDGYCRVPVVGGIPKLGENAFPERHMGLVPTPEHALASASVAQAAEMAEKYLDLDRLLVIAGEAPDLPPGSGGVARSPAESRKGAGRPRIGVIRDAAFQFYYPENLTALEDAGADLVFVSALTPGGLPELDGLYIGGGFPETHAQALAENETFRRQLLGAAQRGLPIYAECGGLMYLGESLVLDGAAYPMAGVFPVVFGFSRRPRGHGYTILQVEKENPYFPQGMEVRGHEFHYSHVLQWRGDREAFVFRALRGGGIDGERDGLCFKNTLATYTHIHALGTPSWAQAMVRAASGYQGASAGGISRSGP